MWPGVSYPKPPRVNCSRLYVYSFHGSRTLANNGQFNCCGYLNPANPPFVTDNTCPNVEQAQKLGGCVTNFGNFANQFLDIVFTAMFGAVALDVVLFLSSVVLIKDRKEQERYRLIDRKYGSTAL